MAFKANSVEKLVNVIAIKQKRAVEAGNEAKIVADARKIAARIRNRRAGWHEGKFTPLGGGGNRG